ncbi:tetratricopeptide repeat protein, partial [Clostridium sp.]|uniref:helix-turn-helix domain-containing protein n=1 Tax=Clostridium sp. TaxID=1506 RepID=UPI00346441DC
MEILSLGEKIKRRRKELNMTLKDLAGDRITPGQISLVESGKSNPSMDLLEYLASTLKTSVEYLMESEETQAEKICLYFENIAESYILNQDLSLGEQYIERALYYAEKYNLEYRKARNLYLRANIHMAKEENVPAQQYFLSANVIFIKNNNYEEVVNTFLNLGKITYELKAYHSSNSYLQQAEKVYLDNDLGIDVVLGEIYYYIASVYFKLDNLDKAINYSYLAKEKFNQLGNKREYGKALLLLTEQYNKKGDIDNAIKYSKKTLEVFRELKDSLQLSYIENNLGRLFYEFNNLEESFKHYNT